MRWSGDGVNLLGMMGLETGWGWGQSHGEGTKYFTVSSSNCTLQEAVGEFVCGDMQTIP
jgi:hypothetical protein